jgi:long-chain acyl-CoA synthetase
LLAVSILSRLVRKRIVRGLGLDLARIVSAGGAATPVDIVKWYRRLGVNFIEGYGMTETGITHVPLPGRSRVGFVGNASVHAYTRVSREGEVQIKGSMNMLGYYRNSELTNTAFTEDGFFCTGDRGEIDETGRLRLIGRLKEEFKTAKGKYVIPAQIEEILSLSPLFGGVAVFGSGMTAPFAMVVLTPAKRGECHLKETHARLQSQISTVLDVLNVQLEHHEQLRFIVVCQEPWTPENGFLTPTLKVRRAKLEQHFAHRFNGWEKLQKKVVWLEAL